MKKLPVGVWGNAHWSLDLIGRTAAGLFPIKAHWIEGCTYSITGGAIVGAIFGALLGFAWSDESLALTTPSGVAIGSLLGLCIGVMFGAVVQTVDDAVDDWLSSSNSK